MYMKKLITFHILKFKLKKMGFQMLELEMIFELPINDLKKYSPEKLALLRIVKFFPEIVKSLDRQKINALKTLC